MWLLSRKCSRVVGLCSPRAQDMGAHDCSTPNLTGGPQRGPGCLAAAKACLGREDWRPVLSRASGAPLGLAWPQLLPLAHLITALEAQTSWAMSLVSEDVLSLNLECPSLTLCLSLPSALSPPLFFSLLSDLLSGLEVPWALAFCLVQVPLLCAAHNIQLVRDQGCRLCCDHLVTGLCRPTRSPVRAGMASGPPVFVPLLCGAVLGTAWCLVNI